MKDNLVKRSWQGCKSCNFCYKDETIQHLFFDCSFAKKVWRIIHMTFGISPPTSLSNLFGNWLASISKKELMQVRVGVCAVLGLCEMSEMILSLTNKKNHHFCVCDPFSNQCGSGVSWIMGATVWRWYHGIYTTSAAGGSTTGSPFEASTDGCPL
jgi:hypothetical protein